PRRPSTSSTTRTSAAARWPSTRHVPRRRAWVDSTTAAAAAGPAADTAVVAAATAGANRVGECVGPPSSPDDGGHPSVWRAGRRSRYGDTRERRLVTRGN